MYDVRGTMISVQFMSHGVIVMWWHNDMHEFALKWNATLKILPIPRKEYTHVYQLLPQILAQSPSKASISLIKCPLPIPPNEGLQDISPESRTENLNKMPMI